MENYKGYYINNRINNKPKFYEGGAHFKYSDLYKILKSFQQIKEEEKNNEKKNNINEKNDSNNKSRNIKPVFQSFTQKIPENKSENGILSFSKSKNFSNLTNETIQISFNSNKIKKSKQQIHFNSNSSLGKNINNNEINKNYVNNKSNNIINIINNLPHINFKKILKETNNPIQLLSIGKNTVKSRNLNFSKLNTINNINCNSLRENTFAKKYINPFNKITHFRIVSPKNNSLSSRNKIISKSISLNKNYLSEININNINNNNVIKSYRHKKTISNNEKPKLLITNSNNIFDKPQSKNVRIKSQKINK